MQNKLKVGDRVRWICERKGKKQVECSGKIVELHMSVFGSCSKRLGASIEVTKTSNYYKLWKRSKAFISVEKLKKA